MVLIRDKVDALVVGTDPFFYSRRVQLATLATRHAVPTIYNVRVRRSRRLDELQDQPDGSVSSNGSLHSTHPEGR